MRGAVGAVVAVERAVPDLDAGRAGGERAAVADVVAVGRSEQLARLALRQHQRGSDVAGQRRDGHGTVLEAEPDVHGPTERYDLERHRDLLRCRVREVPRGAVASGIPAV